MMLYGGISVSEKTSRKVRKDVNLKVVIGVAAGLFILIICFGLLACNYINVHMLIDENVYVNSIDVGGLTVEQAKTKIEQSVNEEYFNKTVQFNYGGKPYYVNINEFVTLDAKKTAEAALETRTNGEKKIVPFKFTVNDEELRKDIIRFVLGVEEKTGFLIFNEDYTLAEINTTNLNEILDIDKTLDIIIENAGYEAYNTIDGVLIKKGDEGFVDALYARVSRAPVNASIGINEDKSTYIIGEVVGISADKDDFTDLYNSKNGVFSISVKPIFPELTTEDLDIEFYQDVLGTYTSEYNANLINRTKNVSLAAEYVNGTIIMPGQVFSYNTVVGKRTAERGFKQATVYTGEGTEEGLGGGICQVSSTIYCAQLRANLKTVSRTNHSYTVAYVPLGQDATVSYGVLDYLFENDTNYPIKIETVMGGGKLTVNILGTKIDKSLTYDIVSVTNSTIAKKEIQKEDPSLPAGETEVKQNGQNGAVVSTYKVYYDDGVEIKREYIGKSTYVPMNRIVLIGTGEIVENPDNENGTEDGDENVTVEPDVPVEGEEENTEPEDVPHPSDEPEPSTENTENTENPEPSTSDTGL